MNDLISIIVPIYNVEEYLTNCVKSIRNQSYKKLEILLIDDGSTDGCGSLIDSFREEDNRIVVIHKENGGLSDARNVGLDNATGTYVMFVDSDDYIPEDCVEYLYSKLKTNAVEISVGRLKVTALKDDNEEGTEKHHEVFAKKESINQLLYANKYSVAAPGKLYLKSLFDDIRFPVGKLHEDVFTTYKVFLKAERVYYGDKLVYYYYHRPGSIMQSEFTIKRLHIIEALQQIERDVPIKAYGCLNGFASQNIEDMYMLLALNPGEEIINKYGIWKRIKKYRYIVLFDSKCSKRVRCFALISYLGQYISTKIYLLYTRIKWRN